MSEQPRAHFEIITTEAGYHVRLVGGNGEIVMTSEVYEHRRDAERCIEIVGEAAGRVMKPQPPAEAGGEVVSAAPETVQTLTSDCGHHCGVITADRGGAHRIIGHCPCPECHGPTGQGASS